MTNLQMPKQEPETTTEICPNCGGHDLKVEIREQRFLYGSAEPVVLVAAVPVNVCSTCGFEFTDARAEDAREEAVCRHLRLLSPKQINALRKCYGLSRTDFAELSKVGTASLARWESGVLLQNPANDQLLYLLHFRENVQLLRERGVDVPTPGSSLMGSQIVELQAVGTETEITQSLGMTQIGGHCRRSMRARFRKLQDSPERRQIARRWSLRGRADE